MSVIIPDDILHATRMTEEELKQEIAIFLFEKNKLTLVPQPLPAAAASQRYERFPPPATPAATRGRAAK